MRRRPPRSTLLPYTALFRSSGFFHSYAVERTRRFHRAFVVRDDDKLRFFAHLRDFIDETPDICVRSEDHTSELQSRQYLVCRLLLEKKYGALRYMAFWLLFD